MYDLSRGTDSGREWIELFNVGTTSIDVSTWKLFENSVNHALKIAKGESLIAPGGYAVIVEDPDKFQLDYPSFSGSLLDSAFSLSNSGEKISLRDGAGMLRESITYSGSRAHGDGNSLSRKNVESASFVAGSPTPGAPNVLASVRPEPIKAAKQTASTHSAALAPQAAEEAQSDAPRATSAREQMQAESYTSHNSRSWVAWIAGITVLILFGAAIMVALRRAARDEEREMSQSGFEIEEI